MDVRNHGDSPHGPLSLAGIADDISAVVREVGVGRRVVVVGHSMGGAATMLHAVRSQVDSHPVAVAPYGVVDIGPCARSAVFFTMKKQILEMSKIQLFLSRKPSP